MMRSLFRYQPPNCDCCGKFVAMKPGASWAQSWSYDMAGEPDLHDPEWRCVSCTEKFGRIEGNCAGDGYAGIITKVEEVA